MNQALITGLITGSVYALVAFGYHLTWITTKTVNFGQGTLLMVGGMAAYVCVAAGLPFGVGMVAAIIVGLVVGVFTERLAIAPVIGRLSHAWVLSTFGVALILQGIVAKVWGLNVLPVPTTLGAQPVTVLGAHIRGQDVFVVGWVAIVVIGTTAGLRWTVLGKAVRAVATNRRAAALQGISPARISMLAYGLAAMGTAGAGALLAASSGVTYDTGLVVGFSAFFAGMLGGLDSSVGVILGGAVVGVAGSLIANFEPRLQEVGVLALIIVSLAVRPNGILGSVPVVRV